MCNSSLNLYCVKTFVKVIENVCVNCELTTLIGVVVTILAARLNTKMFQFLPVSIYVCSTLNSNNNLVFTYDLHTALHGWPI
jgi:patatin-like phospholipase/acyl hydrolase